MGLHGGWLTLGTYINLYLMKLEIVNYGAELGEYAGQRGDRRWAFSLKSSLDI